jgi:hypothetical protein
MTAVDDKILPRPVHAGTPVTTGKSSWYDAEDWEPTQDDISTAIAAATKGVIQADTIHDVVVPVVAAPKAVRQTNPVHDVMGSVPVVTQVALKDDVPVVSKEKPKSAKKLEKEAQLKKCLASGDWETSTKPKKPKASHTPADTPHVVERNQEWRNLCVNEFHGVNCTDSDCEKLHPTQILNWQSVKDGVILRKGSNCTEPGACVCQNVTCSRGNTCGYIHFPPIQASARKTTAGKNTITHSLNERALKVGQNAAPETATGAAAAPVVAQKVTPMATQAITPLATPLATPVATQAITPVATPVATQAITPVTTPVATQAITPVTTPVATQVNDNDEAALQILFEAWQAAVATLQASKAELQKEEKQLCELEKLYATTGPLVNN